MHYKKALLSLVLIRFYSKPYSFMLSSADQVLKQLKKGQYAPTYLLFGEEAFYIDQISDYIEANALTAAEKGFNLTITYGKDVELNPILESARRFPMMAQRQVIIVKEAQALKEFGEKAGQQLLIRYCTNPTPTTILVFCYKHKSLNTKAKWLQDLAHLATVVESKKIYNDKLPSWIKSHFTSLNYSIEDKATFMMAEFIGNDLNRIVNESKKMTVNYPAGSTISSNDVLKHIGVSKEYNIFELQNALAHRDVLKANKIIQYFNANPKDHPLIPTIFMIYTFFSKVLLCQHNKNRDQDSLARMLKINKYFLREYFTAIRNYHTAKILSNLQYIHKADLSSKGVDSPLKDSEILKELIFKIMH